MANKSHLRPIPMNEPIKLEETTIAKAGKCKKHGPVLKHGKKCPLCYLERLLNFDTKEER